MNASGRALQRDSIWVASTFLAFAAVVLGATER